MCLTFLIDGPGLPKASVLRIGLIHDAIKTETWQLKLPFISCIRWLWAEARMRRSRQAYVKRSTVQFVKKHQNYKMECHFHHSFYFIILKKHLLDINPTFYAYLLSLVL